MASKGRNKWYLTDFNCVDGHRLYHDINHTLICMKCNVLYVLINGKPVIRDEHNMNSNDNYGTKKIRTFKRDFLKNKRLINKRHK